MLKTLRANTKWIMIIVAVSFVGMIIFAWGMDIGGRRSGMKAGAVGKINGEEILFTTYDNFVKSQRERYSGNTRLTIDQDRRIHEESWNAIVTQKVVEQDIIKRKISFTDRELVDFMRNNPPQFVYQQQLAPLFYENNQFSMSKYQAFLNPENLKNPQFEQILRIIEIEASGRLPAIKFQEMLTEAVNVNEAQVRERWLTENDKREAEWIFVSANSLNNVGTNIEAEKTQAYYNEHKEDFKRGKRRSLTGVFFNLAPTAGDSADIVEQAEMLVERARRGEDFSELANEYTDDPGNADSQGDRRGGDLGFFGRGRMIKAFEDAAFSLKPGEVSEPVLSQFGCHVIMVDSVKYKDDSKEVDQIKARHILMNIEPSGDTRDAVIGAVTAFRDTVAAGMDFAIQAKIDSLDIFRTPPFEEDAEMIQGISGSTLRLAHSAFRAKTGDLLSVFVNDNGYYVLSLGEALEEGIPPLKEVRSEVETAARKAERSRYAEDYINRVYSRTEEGMSLKEAVEADEHKGMTVRTGEVYSSANP